MRQEGDHNGSRVLLDIAVEVADGVVEHIEMVEGESAEEVARRFCTKFGLPSHFVTPLTEHIVSNLISIIEDDNEDLVFQHEAGPSSTSSQRLAKRPASVKSDPGYGRKTQSARSRDRADTPTSERPAPRKGERRFSERIHSHTYASNSKTLVEQEAQRKRDMGRQSSLSDPVSEKAKTIYMRLYTEFMAQKKRQEEVRRQSEIHFQTQVATNRGRVSKYSYWLMRKRGRKARQFRNYGELLYEEALDQNVQRKKLIDQKKKEAAAKEVEGLTWTPKISKHSHNLKQDQAQYWLRLHTADPSIQEHVNELRKELWAHELMECTFKPQVNAHEDEAGEAGTTSRFEHLYLDSENRQKRRAEYVQWFPDEYTFQPTINKRPQKTPPAKEEGTVFDRLVDYAARLTEKKKAWQDQRLKLVDPVTGQELYKPRTGRRPVGPRNTNSLPIGHFLYQLKAIIDGKKKQSAERDAMLRKQARHVHYVGHNSQKIVEKLKHRNFQEIFEHLDHDKDGVVHLDSADFRRLSAEVVKDLDVVKKLGAERQMSFRQFAKVMATSQKHRGRRGSHACGCIVAEHNKDWVLEHQHAWKMNQLSRNLAARKRQYGSNRQWYRILLADREKGMAKIEALRNEIKQQEMAECTFRPELCGSKKNKGRSQQTRATAGTGFAEHASSSTALVKEPHEVHGFIFNEAGSSATEGWMGDGEAASSSFLPQAIENSGLSSSGIEVPPSSLGLLQSLKLLVAKSREGTGAEGSGETSSTVHQEPTGLDFLKHLQF